MLDDLKRKHKKTGNPSSEHHNGDRNGRRNAPEQKNAGMTYIHTWNGMMRLHRGVAFGAFLNNSREASIPGGQKGCGQPEPGGTQPSSGTLLPPPNARWLSFCSQAPFSWLNSSLPLVYCTFAFTLTLTVALSTFENCSVLSFAFISPTFFRHSQCWQAAQFLFSEFPPEVGVPYASRKPQTSQAKELTWFATNPLQFGFPQKRACPPLRKSC